ncbi:MAG: zf-TFIIB domain-containing protein [Thermoplasmatota archaeon]
MASSEIPPKNMDLEKTINCPKCQVKMKQIYITRPEAVVLVDSCKECEGYWFDREELEKVLDFETMRMDLIFDPTPDHEADFPCPRCQGEMETMKLYHINVDLCKRCNGIWLDEGELKEIRNEYKFQKQQNKVIELLHNLIEEDPALLENAN